MSSYVVKNLNNCGKGSLRDGISFANKNPNTTITFDNNLNGKIKLTKPLPKIINSTKIIGNLNSNEDLSITISTKCEFVIFEFYKTCNCVIEKLCLINASCAILFKETSKSIVNDCLIGINILNIEQPNNYGIMLFDSYAITIGSNPTNSQDYFSNTISGNKKAGIYLKNSSNNLIQNNIIGLSSNCQNKIGNYDGIKFKNSNYNTIGGKEFIDDQNNINNPTGSKGTTTPVLVRPLLGNIISANKNNGISFNSSNYNNLHGNFIGIGYKNLNNYGNYNNGIFLLNSNFNLLEGCGVNTNPFVYYNVIGWNKKNGVQVESSNYNTIQGNFIGCNYDNTNFAPNHDGLIVSGTSKFTVVGGPIPLGNVISGNINNGIYLTDKIFGFDSINTFCGLVAFGGALPNNNGILIDGDAKKIKLNTNVISGNYENGINIKGNSNDILITSNIIGLDTDGNKPLPNNKSGIAMSENAFDIIDGGDIPSVIAQNTISSNGEYGIIFKDNVHNVKLFNTVVGLDIMINDFYSNGLGGILINNCVKNCFIGSSRYFNFLYDKNFAIELNKKTSNIIVSYNFINVNKQLDYGSSKNNIVNKSSKNKVFGNNLPNFN